MDYTIPYKGHRIKLLGNHVVVTPENSVGVTFLQIDAKQLAKDLGTYPNLDIEVIYKLIDTKIEEVAKQKIEDAIKANNSSQQARRYTLAEIYRCPTACLHDSIETILRNGAITLQLFI